MQKITRYKLLSLQLILLVLLAWPLAHSQTGDSLADFEKRFFQRDFASESLEDRLSRLENMVFGQAQTGDPQTRQQKLENVLSKNIPRGSVTKTEPAYDEPIPGGSYSTAPPQPDIKDGTDYPAVTNLEQQLFQQTFTQEGIAKRITRLEQKVFQQTYQELPLVDRVDQLTLKVVPNSPLSLEESLSTSLPKTSQELAPSSLAVYSQLTTLEEQIFGKSYGGELIANRLARLERQLFGTTHSGSIDSRMDRVMSHYIGLKQQYHANVGQPQPYTPNHSQAPVPPSGLTNPTPPQQIVVGSSMGGQQFSQEFLNMLPSGVRQQLEAQGGGSVAGTVPQGGMAPQMHSGTFSHQTKVIVPYSYYQSNPIYGAPGSFYRGVPFQQVMPPQIPQQQDPMRFPGGALGPMFQNQQPVQPMYQGTHPYPMPMVPGNNMFNLNQSLALLESEVFGRTYEGSHIGIRLNNLEQQVFGRTYPQYSFEQRINRLMRRGTYQQGNSKQSPLRSLAGEALNMFMYNQMYNSGQLPYGYQDPVMMQQPSRFGW